MSGNYDVQQVCENGHQITAGCNKCPERCVDYCKKCGAKTIKACPHCNNEISGFHISMQGISSYSADVPSYCDNCGKPYPWTENKIITAIQIFAEFGNLDDEEKKTIEQDINNIAKDIPQAELSARRIKRIWGKCSRAGYEIIMEFASRTAAKILKEQ